MKFLLDENLSRVKPLIDIRHKKNPGRLIDQGFLFIVTARN